MFRRFDSNKRKMGESSSVPLKASQTGPQTEVVVDDPSLVTSSPTAAPVVQAVVPLSSVTPLPSSTGLPLLAPIRVSASDSLLPSAQRDPLAASFNLARETLCFMYQYDFVKGVLTEDPSANIAAKGKEVKSLNRRLAEVEDLLARRDADVEKKDAELESRAGDLERVRTLNGQLEGELEDASMEIRDL